MSSFYKKWTPTQRNYSGGITLKAIKLRIIPKAEMCVRCKQTEGLVQYHCEDYDYTIQYVPGLLNGSYQGAERQRIVDLLLEKSLESLCWRCHMIHHSRGINPSACEVYWLSIANGKIWPPVYKHDFGILARDHGIVKTIRAKSDAIKKEPQITLFE